MKLEDVGEAVKEIKDHGDLSTFRKEKGDQLCEKYGINGGQLNFLLALAAAEKIKEEKILKL